MPHPPLPLCLMWILSWHSFCLWAQGWYSPSQIEIFCRLILLYICMKVDINDTVLIWHRAFKSQLQNIAIGLEGIRRKSLHWNVSARTLPRPMLRNYLVLDFVRKKWAGVVCTHDVLSWNHPKARQCSTCAQEGCPFQVHYHEIQSKGLILGLTNVILQLCGS